MSISQLPAPTSHVDEAKRDMDDHGLAVVADALTDDQVNALRDRLFEQAECEAEAGDR